MGDPLRRYVRETEALRQVMQEQNAVATGPWVLSAFAETRKLPKKLNPLRILLYADAEWESMTYIFESEGYQLRASLAGLMLCRPGGDDIILELCPREDLERAGLPSLEAYAIWKALSTQTACFMTWNQAVCLCPRLTFDGKYIMLERSGGQSDREGNRLRQSGYEPAAEMPAEFSEPRQLRDNFCKVVDVGGQSSDDILSASSVDWTFSFKATMEHLLTMRMLAIGSTLKDMRAELIKVLNRKN